MHGKIGICLRVVLLSSMLWQAAEGFAQDSKSTDQSSKTYHSKPMKHTGVYKPMPERGGHVAIKVTPPSSRGRPGEVLVEVYNRSNVHLALVQFDVTIFTKGLKVTAEVHADDLRPNMSGAQWVKITGDKKNVPDILEAMVTGFRAISAEGARDVKVNVFVDLIRD